MTPLRSRAAMLVPAVVVLSGLTACGSSSSDPGSSGAVLSIVASTNVYGDLAAAVAGDRASVTSLITSPTQDPHEYEATAQDRLAVERADVVIENGGGFDHFVDDLVAAGDHEPVVLNTVDLSGLAPEESHDHEDEPDTEEGEGHAEEEHEHIEGFNEHVWYDFGTVTALAEEIARVLSVLSPDDKAIFEANLRTLRHQLAGLQTQADELKMRLAGDGVAITEPVPLYLLEAVGLVNRTPEEFSEAVEEGVDVPPRALQETLDLVESGRVVLLAYNQQASDGSTEQVRAAADRSGVPVVDFTETLPDGLSYVEWQQQNLENIARAVPQ